MVPSGAGLHYLFDRGGTSAGSGSGPGSAAGRCVVCLASLGRPVSDLDPLAAAARRAGWSSISVELPGVAPSPLPADGSDLHDLAGGVAVAIESAAEGSPMVVVIGHAFGNRVARCLAADRPDLVGGLVLLGCGGLIPGDSSARAALARCFEVPASEESHLDDVREAFFAPGNDPSVWADGWFAEAAHAQGAAGAATSTQDWWLPPVPIRVLAVVGAEDRISPPANARSLVESLGERGRVVIVPRAGHALIPEQETEVTSALVSFLDSL